MQVSLSRQQYSALVDLLYLADWILHSNDVTSTPKTAHYKALVGYLLTKAQEMGAGELVDLVDGEPAPSRVVEDRMQPLIEAYDEQSMWDELAMALGRRDAERSLGREALRKMPANQKVEALLKHEEHWENEFHQHGLERIVVADPARGNGA
jgi:hypothetical protein